MYSVARKKWEQNIFFVISSINLLQNYANNFHLTWIMSLHHFVKPEMLVEDVVPLSCYRKKLRNLSRLNCDLQICQIWIQLMMKYGKYYKRRCTKQASLIRSYRRHHWHNNDMIQLAHSDLSHYFSLFRSVVCILYIFSYSIPHTL